MLLSSCISQKILNDALALWGQHRFRMELNAFYRIIPVPQSHNFALCRLCADLQTGRQCFSADKQRMITSGGKRIGEPGKYSFAIIDNRRSFTVHNASRAHYICPKGVTYGLMP